MPRHARPAPARSTQSRSAQARSTQSRSAAPVLLAALLALSACVEGATLPATSAPPAANAAPAPAPAPGPAAVAPPDAGFHAALNGLRSQRGLPPAVPDARLTAAAQAHAADMARMGRADHTGSDGSTYLQRIAAAGHAGCFPVEDVGAGQASAAQAFADWSASPAHLRNMTLDGPVVYGLGQSGRYYVLILDRVC